MTLTGKAGTLAIVALVVSICINLLLVGVMVGHRWQGGPGRMGPFGGQILRDMPEEARPLVKQVFARNKADFEARRDAVEQARRRVAEILQAETVDQAQLNVALSDLLQKTQGLHELGHRVMTEVAEQLPPDLRRDWAGRWVEDRPGPRP